MLICTQPNTLLFKVYLCNRCSLRCFYLQIFFYKHVHLVYPSPVSELFHSKGNKNVFVFVCFYHMWPKFFII